MKTIANEIEYEAIMQRIDELVEIVSDDTPKTDKNYIELDLLSDMVIAYEKEHYPIGKPSLIDVIKLRMFEMGLTQKALSKLLGISDSRLSELLSGKREPTFKIARTIHNKLNIDSDIILGV